MNSIDNVSFIIIAKNEEFAVEKNIESLSILNCINCQFIFVDSDSKDNTLKIIKNFKSVNGNEILILKLKGKLNAAIARNAGFKKVKKDFVFFIDGDTSVEKKFIEKSIDIFRNDKSVVAIHGILKEIVYSEMTKHILFPKTIRRKYIDSEFLFGGTVFIRASSLLLNGTWDEHFVVNEDFEMALRLRRNGDIVMLPETMGIHHTFEYCDRPWLFFRKGYVAFSGILLRKYLHDFKVVLALARKPFMGIIVGLLFYLMLILLLISSVFMPKMKVMIWLLLSFMVLDILRAVHKKQSLKNRAILRLIYPFGLLYGFVFSNYIEKND